MVSLEFNTGQYTVDVCCMACIEIENNCKIAISSQCVSLIANMNQRSAIKILMLNTHTIKLKNG